MRKTKDFKILGDYLKSARVKNNLSQSDVSRHLGYSSPQFISDIERGIATIPIKKLKLIMQLYQITPDQILDILIEQQKVYYKSQLELDV